MQSRGTRHDEQGHLLGPGTRHSVGDLQSAHAVGHRHDAKTLESGVGVGRERSPLLVGGDEDGKAHLLKISEEAQGVIPHDAETPIHSALAEPVGKVLRDGQLVHAGRLVVRLRAQDACPREVALREPLQASPRV